jgi:hypothetical protein
VGPDEVDAMAAAGVQTMFIQTGHARSTAGSDVMEPDRLADLIERAHEVGMHVVAWYLPTFVDLEVDLRRLEAAAALPVDGLGVDLESTELASVTERNERMLELSTRLRASVGDDKVLSAITLSAVHLEVVNPVYWPGYPFAELGATYDVIAPMAYWSIRTGELRGGERYVAENLSRLRAHVGDDEPIHVVGGIADGVTSEDLAGMVRAIEADGGTGGSLYDWATSTPELWDALRDLTAT